MNIETILARPSVRGLEFRLGLEAFAHKVGNSLGLSRVNVYWRHNVQTAGINNCGDLYLAGVTDEATVSRALVVKYAGYVVHELLHHKYTNFSLVGTSRQQYISVLHNAVEDGWIENTGITSGLLGNIGPLLGELIDTMTREALATVKDWNDPRQYPYILAVHCRKHATVKVPCNPRLTAIFDEAASRCANATSTADTLAIAQWVYDQIKQESEQPKDEPDGRPGKPKDGPTDGQDGPTSPDQEEGGGEGADESEEGSTAPDAPVKSPVGVDAEEVEPKLSEGGLMGNYSSESIRPAGNCLGSVERSGLESAPVPAKLRYEVKRLFDNSGLTEFSRNRKAGVINSHALPTVAIGNDRVFKRRLDIEGVDSAVVLLLDISGSMFDYDDGLKPRIGPAIATCRALLETLSAAGVNTAVIAFGSSVFEVKPFGMNHRKANTMIGRVLPAGGTNDYTALRYSHEVLARRNEHRKLVFVITDGYGNPGGVRQQVQSGNALGITTIGIGIKSNVSGIYSNAVAVNDIADIGAVSFKQIKLAA